MHPLTPSENEQPGLGHLKREHREIVASRTSVRVRLHMHAWRKIWSYTFADPFN